MKVWFASKIIANKLFGKFLYYQKYSLFLRIFSKNNNYASVTYQHVTTAIISMSIYDKITNIWT